MNLDALSEVIARGEVITDQDETRARKRDWWPLTWVQESSGEVLSGPVAVVRPTDTDEVAAVLAWATDNGVGVVVRGGGSGVCGAARADSGTIVLETTALSTIDVDAASKIVTVGAGVFGGVLETELNRHALTLGHSPQSVEISTVGGWIGTSSAGQMTPGHGFIEDRVIGLECVLGDGTVVKLKPSPRTAVGPDLRRLMIGSEGRFGVVTRVSLACSPMPEDYAWRAYRLATFEQTWQFAHEVLHRGTGPTVLRGWDPADAAAAFTSLEPQTEAVAVVGFESHLPGLPGRLSFVEEVAERLGAEVLTGDYGEHWMSHRLGAVETFASVLGSERAWGETTMLDTMEISAVWSDLLEVYDTITSAIGAHAEWVRCHFSHVFRSGLALYFTFAIEGATHAEMVETYHRTWEAAIEACVGAGGSTSHHHGMGRLKAPYLADDIGSGAANLLARIASVCDPHGVLNPGALIPGGGGD